MHYVSASLLFSQPFMNPAREIRTDPVTGQVYYDRTDPVFAMYSHDKIISMDNNAISSMLSQFSIGSPPFFKYDHVLEKVCYYNFSALAPYNIYFSLNMFPYIGEAFNTIKYEVFPTNITEPVFSITLRVTLIFR